MTVKSVTVLVDSREQKPLLFPAHIVVHTRASYFGSARPSLIKVRTMEAALPAGDYAVDAFGQACLYTLSRGEKICALLETKRSIDELAHNCSTGDRRRFVTALNRLCDSCKHPILMLEFLPLGIWQSKNPRAKTDPIHALDVILDLVAERGIHLIWGSRTGTSIQARRRLGEIVLRLLLHFTGVI